MKYQNRIIRSVYFVTTTVVDWIDVFTRPVYKHIIVNSLQYSDILRDFKKFTSRKIVETLQQDQQESRKLWILSQFEYAGRNDRKIKGYRFWQERIDCQEIFLHDYFIQKLNYMHANPVRAEIMNCAEDNRYSSAMDYAGEQGLLAISKV